MARQIINVGLFPNDRTGDSLRVGGTKINENFSELYDLTSGLSEVAFSGDYNDLINTPETGGGGEGDVTGPVGAVDGEFALFSGTTGKIIVGGGVPGQAAFLNVGTGSGAVAAGNRGLPTGGTSGQVLAKVNSTDYNVEWVNQTGGGSGDGDVEGPDGGVADGDVVLFDGTTGKLVKGGGPLGDGAFADFGTGSGDVAEGDHSHADATDSVSGFMSAADKDKLDGIDGNGEENPEPASQGEAEAGTEEGLRSWSPVRIKDAIDSLAPEAINDLMVNESVLYRDDGGVLTSILAVPSEVLSFDALAAGDAPVLVTAEGLKNISTPKSPVLDNGVVEILWNDVDSGLNIYIPLDTGEDAAEIMVQELDMSLPDGDHIGLRGCRLLVQIHNIDGAEKTITFGTDTGFVPVIIRPGFETEILFSGASTNLFLTGLIGLDGTFVWMDATLPETP